VSRDDNLAAICSGILKITKPFRPVTGIALLYLTNKNKTLNKQRSKGNGFQ
jgi:hypothetical protein